MPVGRQRWNHLLFAHWTVAPAAIQSTLPRGLVVDTHAGAAFVGIVPFFMQRLRPAGLPPLPWLSWFLELNVRTYVRDAAGRPGVWFYSLHCNQPIAVALARRFFHLPYQHARMTGRRRDAAITLTCQPRDEAVPSWSYEWTPSAASAAARPGSLEHFLAERYILFTTDRGQLFSGQVEHAPYRLNSPHLTAFSEGPARLAGFSLRGPPVSVFAASAVDVAVYALKPVTPN